MEPKAETCPACGANASGRFCDSCGVALSAACRECGNPLPRGAKFCNMCGAPVAAGAAPAAAGKQPVLPWAVAGLALVALLAVVLVPRLGGNGEQPAPAQPGPLAQQQAPFAGGAGAAPGGNPGAVDLSSMSPREAADRLFNRVMTAVSSGDTAQARQFVPMAIMAYQRVDTLDADGRYHLAALQLVAGDFAAARAEADTLMQRDPTHLFGLFTAAQAEGSRGNMDQARQLFGRFLRSYDAEVAKKLPEYEEHSQALPAMKAEAERVTRGS